MSCLDTKRISLIVVEELGLAQNVILKILLTSSRTLTLSEQIFMKEEILTQNVKLKAFQGLKRYINTFYSIVQNAEAVRMLSGTSNTI